MCINLCWEWRDRRKPDILQSEGGGELTPVVVPRSSDRKVFVTRRRLVGEDGCDSFESRVKDSKKYPEKRLKKPSVVSIRLYLIYN